jgi:glycylpeptide N-tetradecanoyltransferase
MSSSQKAKEKEESVLGVDQGTEEKDFSGDEHENGEAAGAPSDNAPESSSTSKKRKKKSKAARALNALRGKQEIPQELVDRVVDQVKTEQSENAADVNEGNVRAALEQLKIMDVIQGKTGVGGKNKKDMGEHKVLISQLPPRI